MPPPELLNRLLQQVRRDPSKVGQWYLDQNPDVRRSMIGPAEHFIRFGAQEGREPWPGAFTTPVKATPAPLPRREPPPARHPAPPPAGPALPTDAGPVARYMWAVAHPKRLEPSTLPWGAVLPTVGKRWDLTGPLIDTLLRLNVRVVVLDNRSPSAAPLREDVEWVAASYPFNYGRLMNDGARHLWAAGPCHLLFLNDDLHWGKTSLTAFLTEAAAGRFGVLMPHLLNPDGTTQGAGVVTRPEGSGVLGIKGRWEGDEAHLLGGPALALRAELYEQGLRWREDLRITHSDNALSLDARRLGYAAGVVWSAPVTHWEKSSRKAFGDPPEDARLFWADYWPEILRSLPPPACRVHQRPALDPTQSLRVAIIKLDHIGDLAMSKDALARLKERLPAADITVFCATWAQSLFASWGYRTVPVDVWTEGGVLSRYVGFNGPDRARVAEEGAFDLAIDLRVGAEARDVLRTVQARYKAAYGEGWTWGLPASLQHVMPHKDQLRLLIERLPVLKPRAQGGHLVGLNKSATGRAKAWPEDRWRALEKWLKDHHVAYKWYDDKSTTLDAFGDLVARECRVYVGCDTGPTHLAAESGVPVVEIIGGLVPVDEWMANGRVLGLGQTTSCSPCYSPLGRGCSVQCMDVSVQDVLWGIGAMARGYT